MFKVGDKIRIKQIKSTTKWAGQEGVVYSIEAGIFRGVVCHLPDMISSYNNDIRRYSFDYDELELLISNPNQKCMSCLKSAPHSSDEKFVCLSCKTIKELE